MEPRQNPQDRQRLRRRWAAVAGASIVIGSLPFIGLTATPAGACGGLVGENGTIQLVRTTTLAAYHDGIERYMTAFEFTGEGESVGSIVPLPDEPTSVERGGDWTLQRLTREVNPPPPVADFAEDADASAPGAAEVILEAEIDALDITVLRGGGDEVGLWAEENGFLLTPDAPEVLDFYAERSPYFMAAKFDAQRASDLGQNAGDSTPIMATIPTDNPWVPLRILGLGLDGAEQVEADVFLLTDERPGLLAGGPGVNLAHSEPATDRLLDDLRSDENMDWVPEEAWLSYLEVDTPAGELDFDLAASIDDTERPALEDAGIFDIEHVSTSDATRAVTLDSGGDGFPMWPLALGAGAGALVLTAAAARRGSRPEQTP